ncbi:MAG: hypothetical protein HY548_09875 [Elusimicrobia bacterium]|nr:hypothetical protein [Elusimicrobiota bacterium]
MFFLGGFAWASPVGPDGPSPELLANPYRVSSKGGLITKAYIHPEKVHVGDRQEFLIVADADRVTAETKTDNNLFTLHLTEIGQGWYGSWIVQDTVSKEYATIFTATRGTHTHTITLAWSDPCTPPPGGDWTTDAANCNFSGVNGVDNGNLTINGSNTITIITGSTFAWNSGKQINMNSGSIVVGNGAVLKQTYLWMVDADSDGTPAAATQYSGDTVPVGGARRRSLLSSVSAVDCNEGDGTRWRLRFVDTDGDGYGAGSVACVGNHVGYVDDDTDCYDSNSDAYPGQEAFFASVRGDLSFDYNCDEIEEPEVTTLCEETQSGNIDGWGTLPGCGVTAQWESFDPWEGSCMYQDPPDPRTQVCR